MSQSIAETPNLAPRDIRAKVVGKIAQLHGSLADDQQGVFHRQDHLFVSDEVLQLHAGGKPLDPIDVFDNVAEALNRVARRHV